MKIREIHRWDVTPKEAIRIQKDLARKITLKNSFAKIKLIAGCDVAFTKEKAYAAVIILEYPSLKIVEEVTTFSKINFPYISGLLTFREAPALLSAIKKLKNVPDIFLFDGQGIAHPRRMGLATHLGIILNKTSIGCAKSPLYGSYRQPPEIKGRYTLIKDKGEVIGAVLRSKKAVKPVFVSPGNGIDLKTAIKITLSTTLNYRLPEPTRLAHHLASDSKSSR
ncbi:MAG: deoxyribonuclease V [Candidatus Omnitrophica bacterium]|nr:deoxyribonuclease V [Candidatus Omnitrophota bacterium]